LASKKGRNNKTNNRGIKLTISDKTITDENEIARAFAEKLASTFADDTNTTKFDNEWKKNIDNIVKDKIGELKVLKHKKQRNFTLAELNKCIKNSNMLSAADPDGISNKMLSMLNEANRKHLLATFNLSLTNGTIPESWKHARIAMLLKKDKTATDIASYRPISSTSVIGKLAERLVSIKMWQHMKKNRIIIMKQSGFRAKRQTRDNLFTVIQKAQEAMEKKKDLLRHTQRFR
jgi:hypothetical protein